MNVGFPHRSAAPVLCLLLRGGQAEPREPGGEHAGVAARRRRARERRGEAFAGGASRRDSGPSILASKRSRSGL